MTKIAQLWDLIETSSFREDIKGIKDNDDDYNDKEDNNKNDTYNQDKKVDKKDFFWYMSLVLQTWTFPIPFIFP